MSAGMAGWRMVELRCVNARRYVSADGGIAVVATADGWQIINAATGKPMEGFSTGALIKPPGRSHAGSGKRRGLRGLR